MGGKMAEKNNDGAFWGGMLLGSALGTIIGLAIAPRTGRETRKMMQKSASALPELAEDLSSSVQLQAERLSEGAARNWEGTLMRLKEAIAAGIAASQLEAKQLKKTREVKDANQRG